MQLYFNILALALCHLSVNAKENLPAESVVSENLLQNSGFDTGADFCSKKWCKLTASTAISPWTATGDGNKAEIQIEKGSGDVYIDLNTSKQTVLSQEVTLERGKRYKLSLWARANGSKKAKKGRLGGFRRYSKYWRKYKPFGISVSSKEQLSGAFVLNNRKRFQTNGQTWELHTFEFYAFEIYCKISIASYVYGRAGAVIDDVQLNQIVEN
jgi:hypothetical protein